MKTTSSGNGGSQALTSVHVLNLQFLVAVRDALRADAVQAAYDFGIDVATAEALRHASDDRLRALSSSLDRSVFTLRIRGAELAELLQRPAGLRAIFAAVREPPRGPPS